MKFNMRKRQIDLLEREVARLQEEKRRLMDQCYINAITGNPNLCIDCEFKDECQRYAIENNGYEE